MEIHELRRQKQERGEQIRSLEQEARKDQSRIKELQNQVKGLQKRVTDLENSRSYRLGKTLTAPVRWLHKE
jgi:predicted  nucleic acid-binding Zn-ribbon protein